MAVPRGHLVNAAATQTVIRAFVGISVPSAGAMLEALRSDAHLSTLPVRWLVPDGLHITLAFLGETPARTLQQVWLALEATVRQYPVLHLALDEPEPFPDIRRPRIVAAPVQGDAALDALHTAILDCLRQHEFESDDANFRPHVSLGRLRAPLLRGQAAAVHTALRAHRWAGTGRFVARAVSLMRSDLFPDGARYTPLGEAALGAP